MSIDRRKFTAQSAAVIGVLGAAATDSGGQGLAPLLESSILSSGERPPRIGLGTWRAFDVGGDATARAELAAALHVFTAAGARMIDTSPIYQSSESVLGDLMVAGRMREGVFLATNVWRRRSHRAAGGSLPFRADGVGLALRQVLETRAIAAGARYARARRGISDVMPAILLPPRRAYRNVAGAAPTDFCGGYFGNLSDSAERSVPEATGRAGRSSAGRRGDTYLTLAAGRRVDAALRPDHDRGTGRRSRRLNCAGAVLPLDLDRRDLPGGTSRSTSPGRQPPTRHRRCSTSRIRRPRCVSSVRHSPSRMATRRPGIVRKTSVSVLAARRVISSPERK
jgi:hypothetical protein